MEIEVKRIWPNEQCVTGTVDIDGRSFCFSLEDPVREIDGVNVAEWKIPGNTAIPRGRYKVVLDWSNRFNRIMPHVLDVPGYTSIRIHGGNRAQDVEGCIAIGEKRYDDYTIGECAPAVDALIEEIEQAVANKEEVWITIN